MVLLWVCGLFSGLLWRDTAQGTLHNGRYWNAKVHSKARLSVIMDDKESITQTLDKVRRSAQIFRDDRLSAQFLVLSNAAQ